MYSTTYIDIIEKLMLKCIHIPDIVKLKTYLVALECGKVIIILDLDFFSIFHTSAQAIKA